MHAVCFIFERLKCISKYYGKTQTFLLRTKIFFSCANHFLLLFALFFDFSSVFWYHLVDHLVRCLVVLMWQITLYCTWHNTCCSFVCATAFKTWRIALFCWRNYTFTCSSLTHQWQESAHVNQIFLACELLTSRYTYHTLSYSHSTQYWK